MFLALIVAPSLAINPKPTYFSVPGSVNFVPVIFILGLAVVDKVAILFIDISVPAPVAKTAPVSFLLDVLASVSTVALLIFKP